MQSPILYLYPRRPTSVYPKFQKQLMDFRVPFVAVTFYLLVAVCSPRFYCGQSINGTVFRHRSHDSIVCLLGYFSCVSPGWYQISVIATGYWPS